MATATIGAASPLNASDNTRLNFTAGITQTLSRALNDTPSDFLTMTSVSWRVEYSQSGRSDDTLALGIRIVNGATILAAATSGGTFATVNSNVTNTTDTTTGPTAFGYVNTSANKATWDGATVELRQTYTQNMGPDNALLRVDFVNFDITYPANEVRVGSNASTTSTANAGSIVQDIIELGAQASVTETGNAGTPFNEILYAGSSASSTSSASSGQIGRGVLGQAATETTTASAGSDGGDYVVPGSNAASSSTAAAGVSGQVINVAGANATTTATTNSGEPLKFEAEGVLDEWGHFVTGGLDEWGRSYFLKDGATLNEQGDWVDVALVQDTGVVFGAQASTTVTANAGTIGSANVVNGSTATSTTTANSGTPAVSLTVTGASAGTTDTANAGSVQVSESPVGQQASETTTANAGATFVEILYDGANVTETTTATAGQSVVDIVVGGGTATTTLSASAGTFEIAAQGQTATTTDAGNSGTIILPGFIKIQGSKATTTDTANLGSFGVSDLRVFGTRVENYDNPRRGSQFGGAVIRRIMIDKQIRDRVTV